MEEGRTPESAAAPFAPELEPKAPGGCSRPVLVGCGALIVLLGIAAVFFMMKAKDLFVQILPQVQQDIMSDLPDDTSEEDRERLEEAFESTLEAVRDGEADSEALQALQAQFFSFSRTPSEELSREDVLRLIEALEAVGGSGDAVGADDS